MRNSIGNNIILTLFGESHGEYIGGILDGLPAGIKIDEEKIKKALKKRRPCSITETSRVEEDHYIIASGAFNGFTTGTPLCILIPNENTKSSDYEKSKDLPRPSHADYVAHIRYDGFEDYRGGGHFSGRITAAIVACGAICSMILEEFNIKIASHILSCGNIYDQEFSNTNKEVCDLLEKDYPTINNIGPLIEEEIIKAKKSLDSLGGIIQTAIINLPVGLGEPWFDSFESGLAKAIFAVGGVKGLEFGSGFKMAAMRGSLANDEFSIVDNKVVTLTNHNGGINGGLTNGMPVVFQTAVKPTPSIARCQKTVNLATLKNSELTINGRHDPAIIRRIIPVIDNLCAIVVCDYLSLMWGTKALKK